MKRFSIVTKEHREIVDITDEVRKLIPTMKNGAVNILLAHTSAALSIGDLDPGTDLDMLDAFEAMMPKLNYRHYHNPQHVTDHILSTIIGNTLTIPYENGNLVLGDWQKILLIELNGSKQRNFYITLLKEDE